MVKSVHQNYFFLNCWVKAFETFGKSYHSNPITIQFWGMRRPISRLVQAWNIRQMMSLKPNPFCQLLLGKKYLESLLKNIHRKWKIWWWLFLNENVSNWSSGWFYYIFQFFIELDQANHWFSFDFGIITTSNTIEW